MGYACVDRLQPELASLPSFIDFLLRLIHANAYPNAHSMAVRADSLAPSWSNMISSLSSGSA